MHNVASPPDSDVLLVSGGGRFLRIKKKNFFHVCSREGLDHARRIATSVRFVGIFMIIYPIFFDKGNHYWLFFFCFFFLEGGFINDTLIYKLFISCTKTDTFCDFLKFRAGFILKVRGSNLDTAYRIFAVVYFKDILNVHPVCFHCLKMASFWSYKTYFIFVLFQKDTLQIINFSRHTQRSSTGITTNT